jgi:hypothetical protein
VFVEAYTFETKGSVSSVDDSTLSQEDVEVLLSLRRSDKKKSKKKDRPCVNLLGFGVSRAMFITTKQINYSLVPSDH